ncbi:MAG: 2OG-Fe(II) oxygenase [Candidatus Thiodiazotropha endolucinida]
MSGNKETLPESDAFREVICQPMFSSDECDSLISLHLNNQWRASEIGTRSTKHNHYDPTIRQCKVTPFISLEHLEQIVAKAITLFPQIEQHALHFDPEDLPMVISYVAGDYFHWHVDKGGRGTVAANRALSFSVQLSDSDCYDGGDLELKVAFSKAQRQYLRQQGNITLFPSSAAHRVSVLKTGIRYAIVGWFHR